MLSGGGSVVHHLLVHVALRRPQLYDEEALVWQCQRRAFVLGAALQQLLARHRVEAHLVHRHAAKIHHTASLRRIGAEESCGSDYPAQQEFNRYRMSPDSLRPIGGARTNTT